MPENINELNITTRREILPVVIQDQFFKNAPFLAYLRDHAMVPYNGGEVMQNTHAVRPLIGGFYARGANFNIAKVQTLAATFFDQRFVYVNLTEYEEDLEINRGPLAVFSLIDADMRIAMNTISAIVNVALSLHGQTSGSGVVADRPTATNGWIEGVNDGLTNGWEGSIFTAYGTQTRNGFVGNTMNSVPQWLGDTAGNPGLITYNALEESYQDATVGNEEPNLGVVSKAGMAYIKERLQPQQRFAQEKDPIWGVTGVRFNSAMILKDDYWPSARYGVNDPVLGNYLTSTFLTSATPAAASNLPASTTVTVGEVFAWFNTRKWMYRLSNSANFGYGFSGFKPTADSSRVAGQIKAMQNLQCLSPRMQKQLYGFNG